MAGWSGHSSILLKKMFYRTNTAKSLFYRIYFFDLSLNKILFKLLIWLVKGLWRSANRIVTEIPEWVCREVGGADGATSASDALLVYPIALSAAVAGGGVVFQLDFDAQPSRCALVFPH